MGIIVFGYKRHGKDTVCEILEENYSFLGFMSSSQVACDTFLYEQMRESFGYTTKEQCYEDRFNHRQYWYEAIRDYNTPDKTRLGRDIFSRARVYCGIRDKEEFLALKDKGLLELTIWIDASERIPEIEEGSMNLDKSFADIIIENNGTLEELREKVLRLGRHIGEHKLYDHYRQTKFVKKDPQPFSSFSEPLYEPKE